MQNVAKYSEVNPIHARKSIIGNRPSVVASALRPKKRVSYTKIGMDLGLKTKESMDR